MTAEERKMFALDSLRNTLADIREYVNLLKNHRNKYNQSYIDYLKAKYFDRKCYYREVMEG